MVKLREIKAGNPQEAHMPQKLIVALSNITRRDLGEMTFGMPLKAQQRARGARQRNAGLRHERGCAPRAQPSVPKREGTGWDVGHAVRFLLSDHARYVLVVDCWQSTAASPCRRRVSRPAKV